MTLTRSLPYFHARTIPRYQCIHDKHAFKVSSKCEKKLAALASSHGMSGEWTSCPKYWMPIFQLIGSMLKANLTVKFQIPWSNMVNSKSDDKQYLLYYLASDLDLWPIRLMFEIVQGIYGQCKTCVPSFVKIREEIWLLAWHKECPFFSILVTVF